MRGLEHLKSQIYVSYFSYHEPMSESSAGYSKFFIGNAKI